jgi:hypothetical protein
MRPTGRLQLGNLMDLTDFHQRRAKLAKDPGYVDEVLRDGLIKAMAAAVATMKRVRERIKFA